MARRPAGFILWTDDALSSSRIAMMTDQEFRAYWILLWHCWNLSGSLPGPLPSSLPEWERLAGRPVTKFVQDSFIPHPEKKDCYTHPKLYKQLLKREQAKHAGERSAEVRWGNEKGNETSNEQGNEDGNETDASSKPSSLQAIPRRTPLPPKGGRRRGGLTPMQISAFKVDGISWWNGTIAPLLDAPTINDIDGSREGAYFQRLKEYPDFQKKVLDEACRTAEKFKGRGDRGGFLTFDWLTSPKNLKKFLEGNYRAKDQINVQPKPTAEELAAAYTPPPGAPSGWRDRKAPAARRLDMDLPAGGDGADRTGRAAP